MKKNITITVSLIGIFILAVVCLPNFIINGKVFASGETKSSTIGSVKVSDINSANLLPTVEQAILDWQQTEITVKGTDVTKTIDPKQLIFDTTAAISQFEMLTKKPWYAFWKNDKVVHIPIPVTVNDTVIQELNEMGILDTNKTLQKIIIQASYLKEHEVEAVINADALQMKERISFQMEDLPANEQGVAKLIPLLNDVTLIPNQSFSLLSLLGEQAGTVNDASLDFVASILYSVILQTEYEILERHSQQIKPSYLQLGIEADINAALAKDLQFINRSNQLGKMKATIEGNQLKIELFTAEKDKDITVRVSKDKIVKPRTIYRYSDNLKAGQERVEQEGKEGVRVEVHRSIVENGATEEQFISRDYYAPKNRIITRSSQEPITVTPPTKNAGQSVSDPDLEMDLDGNGLHDITPSTPEEDGPEIVYGYYDKGGNFIQTSP
ncbi:G5 domain-containing protein [Lysinibacillus cavernae]|uniref:G5 domain-containing protein n=1 Tax=Lysinibacillus cavernae TaxID=2666135 RepID=UPI0012D87DD4|nr:G5 domain-containing protein [Lysinibacillus cavernae]